MPRTPPPIRRIIPPGSINFRNETQVVLWNDEIAGQLSDGFWENANPRGHWRDWRFEKTVRVDSLNVGRDFYAAKDNYNLLSKDLLEVVADRMISNVGQKTGRTMSLRELRAELKDMMAIIRTRR